MFFRNKEFQRGLCWITATVIVLSVLGFVESVVSGVWILIAGVMIMLTYVYVERYRYRRLRGLSEALDALLHNGAPLSISEYEEGELSILANQIQKMTLRLMEAADLIKKEREYLADSLADISHQLRTPLTAMNLTVTMLRSPDLTEARRIYRFYKTGVGFPWKTVCLGAFCVFLIVFASAFYAVSKLRKDNPIDAIRMENL